jgi:hypothetical protein
MKSLTAHVREPKSGYEIDTPTTTSYKSSLLNPTYTRGSLRKLFARWVRTRSCYATNIGVYFRPLDRFTFKSCGSREGPAWALLP